MFNRRFLLLSFCCIFIAACANTKLSISATNNANTYYLDAINGNDKNDGLSPSQAWQTLTRVNKHIFNGGDNLLLKTDTEYFGMLKPQRKPTRNEADISSVVISNYGAGAKPKIHAQGKHVAALYLHNTEGWHISNLALTNKGRKPELNRHGIWLHNQTLDTVRNIKIEHLDVYDVVGTIAKSEQAGTAIYVSIDRKQRRRFDNLVISHNHIKNSQRNGIIFRGAWQREDRYASTNIVISHNLIEGVGGDGIIIGGADGGLVEWNVVRQHPYLGEEGGAAAGIWPFASDNTIIQFNEVSGQKSWIDGQAYDSDYNSRNNTFQYNLSHNNRGGFMLLCSPNKKGSDPNIQATLGTRIKFNLSIDDGYRALEGPEQKHYHSPLLHISGGGVRDSIIASNVFIVRAKPDSRMDSRIIGLDNWGGHYPIDTEFNNNIVWAQSGHNIEHDMTHARDISYSDNQFIGNVAAIPEGQEVKAKGNTYQQNKEKVKVELTGTKQELEQFKQFLKAKGNPHEQAGMEIIWP